MKKDDKFNKLTKEEIMEIFDRNAKKFGAKLKTKDELEKSDGKIKLKDLDGNIIELESPEQFYEFVMSEMFAQHNYKKADTKQNNKKPSSEDEKSL